MHLNIHQALTLSFSLGVLYPIPSGVTAKCFLPYKWIYALSYHTVPHHSISISQVTKRVLIEVLLHWTTSFISRLVHFRHFCFCQYDSDLFRVTPTWVLWIRAHSEDTNCILKDSSIISKTFLKNNPLHHLKALD